MVDEEWRKGGLKMKGNVERKTRMTKNLFRSFFGS